MLKGQNIHKTIQKAHVSNDMGKPYNVLVLSWAIRHHDVLHTFAVVIMLYLSWHADLMQTIAALIILYMRVTPNFVMCLEAQNAPPQWVYPFTLSDKTFFQKYEEIKGQANKTRWNMVSLVNSVK